MTHNNNPVLFYANTKKIYGAAGHHFCMVDINDEVGKSLRK
jgi:hypothetical protein